MIGYCHLRNKVRIFALHRVKLLHQTKETFEVPEDFGFEDFTEVSFGVFQGEPMKLRIWFSSEVAGYVKEKIWHESQEIHPRDDGSIIFEAEVAETVELKSWIMSWGANALVLEPEFLGDEIRSEAMAMVGRLLSRTAIEKHHDKREAD